MSTKKRFTISPDLASGIRSTIQSAATNQGQLHYDMMSLEAIEPDPQNPRKLSITREELLHGLNQADPHFQIKQQELENLQELAESIKRIGIRNAIEVYKEGQRYRIVSGERRFLAALLLGQKSVPVRINQKPDEFNLRYTQWVENINRQDLSLWEKFHNLISIATAYKEAHHAECDEKALQRLLGVSQIQTYRYVCLLKADEKILELIQARKLNNLKIVQELVSMKDKGARKQILSWIASTHSEVTSLASYRAAAGKKSVATQAVTKQAIHLGKINHTDTAKYLLEMILSDKKLHPHQAKFANIDWSSGAAITKAFKALFRALEKELSVKETA